MTIEHKRSDLITGVAFFSCLAIFLILMLGIIFDANFVKVIDDAIYNFVISFKNPALTNFFKVLTEFGGAKIIIITSAIILIALNTSRVRWNFFAGMSGALIANQVLKNIIQRPRPELARRLVEENGFSFPSGHSMCSMAFYGFMIYFMYRTIREPKLKWTIIILISVLIATIGVSRIYLGVHYPSDVIAGFALTAAYLIAFVHFVHPLNKKDIKDIESDLGKEEAPEEQ